MRGNFVTDRNGESNPNYVDGRKGTRLYRIYYNIITRCYNKRATHYSRYGGRNITVCEDWLKDFKCFRDWSLSNGYTDELSIDRINNDLGYEPSNCRWVNSKSQSRNTSTNKMITLYNETKPLIEWCESFGINYRTVQDRLKRGWTIFDALKKPVQTKFRRNV